MTPPAVGGPGAAGRGDPPPAVRQYAAPMTERPETSFESTGAGGDAGWAAAPVVRSPVYVQVADQIRDAIVGKQLRPGQALPSERELTERFGVSRTSVREALRTLEAEGWLAGRTVVTDEPSLSRDFGRLLRVGAISVFDLVYFRSMLEREGIVKAVLEDDPGRWDAARAALDEMSSARDSVERFLGAYLAFHLALVDAGGNRIAALSMQATHAALAEHVHECFRQVAEGPHRVSTLDRLYREHVEILDVAASADAGRACDLLDEHFRHFYTTLLATSIDDPSSGAAAAG
jgi:GntR family transcriptional repressor for pyruvate dehydrogenase complex